MSGVWKNKVFEMLFIVLSVITIVSFAMANSFEEYFEKGKEAYAQSDYGTAVDMFQKAVEINSNDAQAYYFLGLSLQGLGSSPSQVSWNLKTATEIDPNYIEAYDQLGKVYYQAGEFDEAEKSCLKALELNPNLTGSQFTLGWIYLVGKSQPEQAAKYFQEVLKKADLPAAYFGLGVSYAMQKNHPPALEIITILKQKGNEDLAGQLEAVIHRSYPAGPSAVTPEAAGSLRALPLPEIPTIQVQSQPVQIRPSAESKPFGGFMRVQLRGKMTNTAPKDENAEETTAPPAKSVPVLPPSSVLQSSQSPTSTRAISAPIYPTYPKTNIQPRKSTTQEETQSSTAGDVQERIRRVRRLQQGKGPGY